MLDCIPMNRDHKDLSVGYLIMLYQLHRLLNHLHIYFNVKIIKRMLKGCTALHTVIPVTQMAGHLLRE
jgi:hypothetical protein